LHFTCPQQPVIGRRNLFGHIDEIGMGRWRSSEIAGCWRGAHKSRSGSGFTACIFTPLVSA
jgi:hypothetical protein